MKDFAERLKDLRTDRGMTMKQLAAAVDVSEMAISRWESRSRIPNIILAMDIAKYFGVTLDYLVGMQD